MTRCSVWESFLFRRPSVPAIHRPCAIRRKSPVRALFQAFLYIPHVPCPRFRNLGARLRLSTRPFSNRARTFIAYAEIFLSRTPPGSCGQCYRDHLRGLRPHQALDACHLGVGRDLDDDAGRPWRPPFLLSLPAAGRWRIQRAAAPPSRARECCRFRGAALIEPWVPRQSRPCAESFSFVRQTECGGRRSHGLSENASTGPVPPED